MHMVQRVWSRIPLPRMLCAVVGYHLDQAYSSVFSGGKLGGCTRLDVAISLVPLGFSHRLFGWAWWYVFVFNWKYPKTVY